MRTVFVCALAPAMSARRAYHRTMLSCMALSVLLAVPAAAQPRCPGDCDGDGVVSPGEFNRVAAGIIGAIFDPPLGREYAECLDADGDGSASVREATAFLNNGSGRCSCVGDCNGDGRVTVAELIDGVDAALGTDAACPNFLVPCPPGQPCIDISALQTAVVNALLGCP